MGYRAVATALPGLLERVEVRGEVIITAGETATWGPGVLETLVSAGLVVPYTNAKAVVCDECDEGCQVEPVPRRMPGGQTLLLGFCEVRDDIQRVVVEPARLKRWRMSMPILGAAIGRSLELSPPVAERLAEELWCLGKRRVGGRVVRFYLSLGFRGASGRALSCLIAEHITGPSSVLLVPMIKSAKEAWPRSISCLAIGELIDVEDGQLRLDEDMLQHALGRSNKKAASPGTRFPTPTGATWEDVVVRFEDDRHLEIQVRHAKRRYSFAELGMQDGRTGEPDFTWGILRVLAGSFGEMGWGHAQANDANKARMSQLRQRLRELLGLKGDPFHRYKRGVGWRSRFTLRPPTA